MMLNDDIMKYMILVNSISEIDHSILNASVHDL